MSTRAKYGTKKALAASFQVGEGRPMEYGDARTLASVGYQNQIKFSVIKQPDGSAIITRTK